MLEGWVQAGRLGKGSLVQRRLAVPSKQCGRRDSMAGRQSFFPPLLTRLWDWRISRLYVSAEMAGKGGAAGQHSLPGSLCPQLYCPISQRPSCA